MASDRRLILDVSNQNRITRAELAAARPAALICKATEGADFFDVTYSHHRMLAAGERIPFGAYLFLRVDSPGNEAAALLRFARPRAGDLQPIIDAEDLRRGVGALARRADACARELERRGYRPLLYCSASVWGQLVAELPALRRLRVWEAQYPGRFTRWAPQLARLRIRLLRGANVVMWQWTDSYQIGNSYWPRRRFDASRLLVDLNSLRIPEEGL